MRGWQTALVTAALSIALAICVLLKLITDYEFQTIWSWVGFEAAPNYAEESKDPHRTIPIAVYVSCVFVGVLYTLAAWASVSSYGPGNQAFDALATGSTTVFGGEIAVDYLNFNVVPANELIGTWLGQLMSVFIITGAFACAAALNNAGLRYTYSLGREGLLPKALGRTHPKHKTPHVAVLTQAAIALAMGDAPAVRTGRSIAG